MHQTSSLVTMEAAFLIIVGVMAIMTVEITVMKMDVSDGEWEERQCFTMLTSFGLSLAFQNPRKA